MALATFVIDKYTSSNLSVVYSGVTDNTVCFCNADSDIRPAQLGSYALGIPQVLGTYNYSFENWIVLRTIALPNNSVSDIRIIGPYNQIASGVVVRLGIASGNGFTPQNTGITYATGVQHYNNGSGFYDFDTAYLLWTISGATVFSGGVGAPINQRSNFLVAQMEISATASGNVGTLETYTLQLRYTEN